MPLQGPPGLGSAQGCSPSLKGLPSLPASPISVSTQMLHSRPPGQTSSLCTLPAQPWANPHSHDGPGKLTNDCHDFLPGPGPWAPLLCKMQTLTLVQGHQQAETWSKLALFHRVTPAHPGAAGSPPKLQKVQLPGVRTHFCLRTCGVNSCGFLGSIVHPLRSNTDHPSPGRATRCGHHGFPSWQSLWACDMDTQFSSPPGSQACA